MPPRLIITGIPTAGKSALAIRLAERLGGAVISTDVIRAHIRHDRRYQEWHEFYLRQDEHSYYASTDYDQQWQNLVQQSEGLWPGLLEFINRYKHDPRPIVIEGVNLLPHLVHRDLSFPASC
jgi:2-phosphoglycerate kinase